MRPVTLALSFVTIDALVLGLTQCRPAPAPVIAPAEDAAASAPVSVRTDPAPEASSVVASAPAAVSAPPSGVVSSFVHPPETCAELDAAIDAAFRVRSCRTDADCTNRSVYCGCATPVAKVIAGRIDDLQKKWSARRCQQAGPPRPCATCPLPPVPTCASGVCTPGRAP
ncbi:MAG: hypothetical protein U0235_12920 [Polyangiaceae bacterium]